MEGFEFLLFCNVRNERVSVRRRLHSLYFEASSSLEKLNRVCVHRSNPINVKSAGKHNVTTFPSLHQAIRTYCIMRKFAHIRCFCLHFPTEYNLFYQTLFSACEVCPAESIHDITEDVSGKFYWLSVQYIAPASCLHRSLLLSSVKALFAYLSCKKTVLWSKIWHLWRWVMAYIHAYFKMSS